MRYVNLSALLTVCYLFIVAGCGGGGGSHPSLTSITITPDATIEDTMVLFTEKRCRHLPVIEAGRLIWTISIGDVTRWMADAHRAEAEHLKNYITSGFSA